MAMLCLSPNAYAYDFEIDGIYYEVLSVPETTVQVVASPQKYKGSISLPSTANWNGRSWTVTQIGSWAFSDCPELSEIVIPPSIAKIGMGAFTYTPIKRVHIADISAWMKVDLSNLAYYKSTSPFYNHANLVIDGKIVTELAIPSGIKVINGNLSGCGSLKTVILPPDCLQMTYSGTYYGATFANCINLETIIIEGENVVVCDHAFDGCIRLNDVSFLNKCRSIGEYAFAGCSSLTQVVIPDNIEQIGSYPFSGCENLESLTIGGGVAELPKEGSGYESYLNLLGGCKNLKILEIADGEGALDIFQSKNYSTGGSSYDLYRYYGSLHNNSLDSVKINREIYFWTPLEHLHYTCVYAPLAGNTSLKKAFIGGSMKELSPYFFHGCSSLESVSIGSEITRIGKDCFSGCNAIKQIVLYCTTPPKFSQSTKDLFSHTQLMSIEIIVPQGTLEVYKNSDGWKEFLNIKEGTSSGINNIVEDNNSFSVTVIGGVLHILNKDAKSIVRVFSTQGSLLVETMENEVNNLATGIYIVTIGNKSFKIKI